MKRIIYSVCMLVSIWGLQSCLKEDVLPSGSGGTGGSGDLSSALKAPDSAGACPQNVLVTNMSALWCGPCGQQGIPRFYEALNINPAKVIGIKVNGDQDVLSNPISNALASYLNYSGGIPAYAEGINRFGQDISGLKTSINNRLKEKPAAWIGINGMFTGDTINAATKVRFYSTPAADMKYNVCVYVLEDSVSCTQNGITQNPYYAAHINRGVMNPTSGGATDMPWGNPIASGTLTAGKDYVNYFRFTSSTKFKKKDLSLVSVIYQMQADSAIKVINVARLDAIK